LEKGGQEVLATGAAALHGALWLRSVTYSNMRSGSLGRSKCTSETRKSSARLVSVLVPCNERLMSALLHVQLFVGQSP
jgi:hypothetical protein